MVCLKIAPRLVRLQCLFVVWACLLTYEMGVPGLSDVQLTSEIKYGRIEEATFQPSVSGNGGGDHRRPLPALPSSCFS